jgi:hypothetical protein
VELAERWGYALSIDSYLNQAVVHDITTNPAGVNARIVALAQSDPEKYPLSVLADRPLVGGATTMPPELVGAYYARDSSGNFVVDAATGGPSWRTVSPEMPDSVYEWAAAGQAQPLAALRAIAPISIVLNGGEYGVSVPGHSQAYWAQDPQVVAAKGDSSWYDYASRRVAHYEQVISDASIAAVPDRALYLYYDSDSSRDQGAYTTWSNWSHDYGQMRSLSDIANGSLYYKHSNTGWTGGRDMLTQVLNATAHQQEFGDKLSYHWLNGGYGGEFSDLEHYTGFLKQCYTAGMIGGVAGFFSYPTGGFDAPFSGAPPSWLEQIEALSQVHAAFSYLEDYLRHGELLPGPNSHVWSPNLPAYELPTGDATARVLARKLEDRSEWLVTAWAADGADRLVTVAIDDVGSVDVVARASGSIYLLTQTGQGIHQRLLDPDGMFPSSALNIIAATSDTGGRLSLPGRNVVLDGEPFQVHLALDPGYRLIDVVVDEQSIGPMAQYALDNIHASHNIHFVIAPDHSMPGDFDGNNVVDASDYVLWRKRSSAAFAQTDYQAWRSQFGQTLYGGSGTANAPPSPANVPEPGAFAIGVLAAICMMPVGRNPGLRRAA